MSSFHVASIYYNYNCLLLVGYETYVHDHCKKIIVSVYDVDISLFVSSQSPLRINNLRFE